MARAIGLTREIEEAAPRSRGTRGAEVVGDREWKREPFPLPILAHVAHAFAHTLGEFGVVLMVGGNLPGETRTLSVAIYDRMQAFDDHSAGVMAATLLTVAVATLMVTTALSRRVSDRRA